MRGVELKVLHAHLSEDAVPRAQLLVGELVSEVVARGPRRILDRGVPNVLRGLAVIHDDERQLVLQRFRSGIGIAAEGHVHRPGPSRVLDFDAKVSLQAPDLPVNLPPEAGAADGSRVDSEGVWHPEDSKAIRR